MGGWGGLIELVLVLSCLLGWGALEWRGARLDRRKAEATKARGASKDQPDGK